MAVFWWARGMAGGLSTTHHPNYGQRCKDADRVGMGPERNQ
jgi:hypothetical protein